MQKFALGGLVVVLLLAGCSSGSADKRITELEQRIAELQQQLNNAKPVPEPVGPPAVKQGNTLTLVVKDIQMKDAVYYQDTDFEVYAVTPSAPDRKLAAVLLQVFNGKANEVLINVGAEGYILLDKPGNEYKSVNPFGRTRRRQPFQPNDNRDLIKFVWGSFTLRKDYSIEAWALFDVPANITPAQLRWYPIETVSVAF